MVKKAFLDSTSHYTSSDRGAALWLEIEKAYSHHSRCYHTLIHLNHLLNELLPHKSLFKDWDVLLFALVYHDVIYSVTDTGNEEKSAALAVERLKSMGVSEQQQMRCSTLIIATKKHEAIDPETNLFTDADLSILGSSPVNYLRYANQVRKEYSIYPDLIYKPGRKKVLQHFLSMDRIFKTDTFFEKYERIARHNLHMEISGLV